MRGIFAGITVVLLLAWHCTAAGAGTDIVGMPSDWRATPMEGTDAVVATNRFDEPMFIQTGETIGGAFAPAPIEGDRLADEFKRLCLDTGFDDAKLRVATAGSSFAWQARTFEIRATKGAATYPLKLWSAPEARVQIWNGDTEALKNFPTYSRWRRGATISTFSSNRIRNPACNLTVMATGFRSPDDFLARMKQHLGSEPAKVVTKPEWADGYWSIAGDDGAELRIGYSMVSFDRPEQLLHVSVAKLPARKGSKG